MLRTRHVLLVTAAAVTATVTTTPTLLTAAMIGKAAPQKITILSVSPHCLDENDEDLIIYVNEGDKACSVTVRVTGRGKTKSKVSLEEFDVDAEKWTKSDTKDRVTNTTGRATFTLTVKFPSKPGDQCYSFDDVSHRFSVAKSGKYKAFRSAAFDLVFTSAEDNPACADEYGESEEPDEDNFDIADEE